MKTRNMKKMEKRVNKLEKQNNLLLGGMFCGLVAAGINAFCNSKTKKMCIQNTSDIQVLSSIEDDFDDECDFCEE